MSNVSHAVWQPALEAEHVDFVVSISVPRSFMAVVKSSAAVISAFLSAITSASESLMLYTAEITKKLKLIRVKIKKMKPERD